MLADVEKQAKERQDDATAFALNIKMPSVVLLREYALLAHLRAEFPGSFGRTPTDLKDVLKVQWPLQNYVCGGMLRADGGNCV